MATVYQIVTDETGTTFDTGTTMTDGEANELVDTIMDNDAMIADFETIDGSWALLIDVDLQVCVLQIKW